MGKIKTIYHVCADESETYDFERVLMISSKYSDYIYSCKSKMDMISIILLIYFISDKGTYDLYLLDNHTVINMIH